MRALKFFASAGVCLVILLVALAFGSPISAGSDTLQATGLEASLPASLPLGGTGSLVFPAYDSGWLDLGIRPDPIAISLDHNLGGDTAQYLVSLICRDDTTLAEYDCTDQGFLVNAHWYGLTASSVQVYAWGGSRPDDIRLRIYIAGPAYDSDWVDLGIRPDPIAVSLTHSLGGNANDYLVSLICQDDTELGVYDCTDQGFLVNAQWFGLTNDDVQIYAWAGARPDDVRLRIFTHPPAYDSGWLDLGIRPDPIAIPIDHDLGGNPDEYLVDLECQDDTSLGVYNCSDLGFLVNTHWFDQTSAEVQVYAWGGSRPDDIRLRIWAPRHTYLPIGLKEQLGRSGGWQFNR